MEAIRVYVMISRHVEHEFEIFDGQFGGLGHLGSRENALGQFQLLVLDHLDALFHCLYAHKSENVKQQSLGV